MTACRALVALAIVAASATPALADRVIAVAPLHTLGAEDKSKETASALAEVQAAIAKLPDTTVIPADQVAAAVKHATKPALKMCEGEPACVAEIGKLVGAQLVVTGEVGGLGEARVIYLSAIDSATGNVVRSTSLAFDASASTAGAGGATGAVARLLDPDHYRGLVHFAIDVAGASVFVNGEKRTLSPQATLELGVGPQAVMVTHPQYRTFVRFVDVGYGKVTEVPVAMQEYPIVQHAVTGAPTNLDKTIYRDPPVYRRWYVVIPAAVALFLVSDAIAHDLSNQPLPYNTCVKLTGSGC